MPAKSRRDAARHALAPNLPATGAVRYVGVALAIVGLTACASNGSSQPPSSADARIGGGGDAAGPGPDAVEPTPIDWRARTLYLVMPDRFENGDPRNDDLGLPDCFDPTEERRHHGGDLAGLEQRIPYLQELGVGALWTTPVYRQSACGYHGYWADFAVPPVVEVEPKLGSAEEMDRLLERLHEAEIGYVLDMIVNHAGYGARVVTQEPGWFHAAQGCEKLGPDEIYCPLSRLPDFAQEDADVAAYLDTLSELWVSRFDIDGIRMDTVKHVELSYFAEHFTPTVRAARPGMFMVGEVFDGSSPAVYQGALDAGFDSAFDFALYYALLDTFGRRQSTNRVADLVQRAIDELGMEQATWMTNMLGNHDLPRFEHEMSGGMGSSEKIARYRLALIALFTVPGIPQLYAGDEVGLAGTWPDNRRMMPDWLWSADTRSGEHPEALDDPAGTFDLVSTLTRARGASPALYRGSYAEVWRQNAGPPVWAFYRGDGDEQIVVVFNNGDDAVGPMTFDLAANPGIAESIADGVAIELLGGPGAPVADGKLTVELPGLSAAIYRLP